MPALPNVAQVLRVAFRMQQGENLDVATRLYLSYSGDAQGPTQLSALALAMATNWQTHIGHLFPTALTLNEVHIEDLTTPSSGVGDWTGSVAGSRGADELPLSTALLVNYKVARRYRGGKPRSYWPAGVVGDVGTPTAWAPAFITEADTAYQAFVTAITSAGFGNSVTTGLVNVSFYAGVNPPITLPSGRVKQSSKVRESSQTDVITGFSINPKYGSQRDRVGA